ncbi:MAG: ATP-binding protein [Anaerolineales bacterium]|nr:ATP-binding protein [Anaerolineales bacterium]
MEVQEYVGAIDAGLPQLPAVRPGGSVLMMAGLPGSGKSSVAYSLCTLTECVVVSTDAVRQRMSKHPGYTLSAMSLVYEVCYAIIRRRLHQGQRVVFDASNYLAARRQRLCSIAAETNAPVAVCYVQASQEVVEARLRQRINGVRGQGDISEADWSVYMWMLAKQEPLQREHFLADTTSTPAAILAKALHHYWKQIETTASFTSGYADLQPTYWADSTHFDD